MDKSEQPSVIKCPICRVSQMALKKESATGECKQTCESCGHSFQFGRAEVNRVKDIKSNISFTINGASYKVGNEYHPATSLLEYMRKKGISRGTKGTCFEGGCGVCLVTITFLDPLTKGQKSCTVNSCCLQLYTCDGLDITTVEGLGNTRDGLHPIQDRLAKHNGAQCGYCTPGQVMTMYGLLQNNPQPTMQEVEDAYDATICRCTGYRPILDAMKSFASDAPPELQTKGGVIDIEELNGKRCKKTGKACRKRGCTTKAGIPGSSKSGSDIVPRSVHIVNATAQWFKPTRLLDLYPLLRHYASDKYRLVFGNTGFGVYGEIGPWNYDILIDIKGVQDMYTLDLTPSDHIIIGANVTLAVLKVTLEKTTEPGLPYAKTFAQHLGRVASSSIRNMSTWAGNLMLKNRHNDFASDVFTMLETVGAQLTIATGNMTMTQYSLTDFLSLDMAGKVILSASLPKYTTSDRVIRTCKTSHRLQLCHAHVASGFNFQVDAANDYLVKSKPTIVIQGISGSLVHAVQTEAFLTNKKLGDATVLQSALTTLSGEIVPDSDPLLSSPTYRKSLALGHFYKFALGVCQNKCTSRFMSGGPDLDRPLQSGIQDYGTPNTSVFPATQPMMKLTMDYLTTGEVNFIADLPPKQGQLFAAAVLSTQGNAKIQSIDPSGALQIPGVVKFIQASDIPGVNDWRPHGVYPKTETQELFCSSQVYYAGQPIGLVVAEDEVTARSASFGVHVTYTDIQPTITTVEEAIQQQAFYKTIGPYTQGDAGAAMASAPHKIQGRVRCSDQYNFHLENQAAWCSPTDTGGMDVMATAQWIDLVQGTVAQVLGIKESNITVEAQRLGGGFGGKTFYPAQVAGMCAVAAHVTKSPILLNMDLHANMQFQGKRTHYLFDYEIGFDDTGKLLAIIMTTYSDVGGLFLGFDGNEVPFNYIDNVYFCPNWSYFLQPCKTHKPVSTPVRAPGSGPSIFAMECMMDHIAQFLKKDLLEVRKINLFKNGETTLGGVVLSHCLTSSVISQLETDINYTARVQAVNDFNRDNRWKKRGIQLMPSKYAMGWQGLRQACSVTINHGDGSVFICHGGIDMGQGINTKVIQCCAYKLGVPIDLIKIKPTTTDSSPNSSYTGSSTTSEIVSLGVTKCCDDLLAKMAPSKAKLTNPTWEEIAEQCYNDLVDLRAFFLPVINDPYPSTHYSCWSACCAEVELDVLTGQYQILQVDFLFDAGTSLNPELDMGQLEGGFMLGVGLFLLESLKYDATTCKLLNDGTWEYKPPLGKDLPIKFNAKFLRNTPNPTGFLGSKAVGEAPVASGAAAFLALKRAVESARSEMGQEGYFVFNAPASPENVQTACLNNTTQYTFGN